MKGLSPSRVFGLFILIAKLFSRAVHESVLKGGCYWFLDAAWLKFLICLLRCLRFAILRFEFRMVKDPSTILVFIFFVHKMDILCRN